MTELRIGYSPLNDAALIILAEALGLYAAEGLEVSLSREANWSNIRDKLAYGQIDAAHILAPLPLASRLGLGPSMGGIIAPMALGVNGNSVVVSSAFKSQVAGMRASRGAVMSSGHILAHEVSRHRLANLGRLVLAMPFTYSPHHFVLRHWAAAAGLDPDRQIQWVVLPPSRMADMLSMGVIDGFCSGSPWPQTAQLNGQGEILFSDPDYWTLKPEKVLGVREDWAKANPDALISLIRALLKAAAWASDASHQSQMIDILAEAHYVNAPRAAIEMAFDEGGAGLNLDPETTTFPWISHAKWFMSQMVKWEMIKPDHDFDAIARQIYRPDLWRAAALSLGLNRPLTDEKNEGGKMLPWSLPAEPQPILMPPNILFDGGIFRCVRPKP